MSGTCADGSRELHRIIGPQDTFTPATNLDRYGFSHVLAQYVGLPRPRRPFCTWIHGWVWWEDTLQPEDLIGPRPLGRDLSIVVGSTRQAQLLQGHGYQNVIAGGVPYIYVPPQEVQRNRNALLAFIGHSAESERFEVFHAEYLDYLASMNRDFEDIYVSVFALDSSEKLRSEITRRGLRVLNGANPIDKNSMLRTRRALEYVGHVSTNTMGSHIAYALAAGCRTSVWCPTYKYDYSVLANSIHGFSRSYVERMEYVHSDPYLRKTFPLLFDTHTAAGHADEAAGLEMVGARHQLRRQQVLDALGWTLPAQFRGFAAGAARRARRHFRAFTSGLTKPTFGQAGD